MPVHPGYDVPLVPPVYTVPPVAPGQVYSNPVPPSVPVYAAPPPSIGPGYPQLPPPGYSSLLPPSMYNPPPLVPTPAPVLNPFSLPPPPVASSVLSSNPGKEPAKSRLETSGNKGSSSAPNHRHTSSIDPCDSRKRPSNHTGPRNSVDPWKARDYPRNGASSDNRQSNRIDPWETKDQPRKESKSNKMDSIINPWQSSNKQAQSKVSMMRRDTHTHPIAQQSLKSSKTAQQLYMPPNEKSNHFPSQQGQKEPTEVVKDDEYFRNLARQRIAAKTGSDRSQVEKESLPDKEQNKNDVTPTKPVQNPSAWVQIQPNVYARRKPRTMNKHPDAWVQIKPNVYANPKTLKKPHAGVQITPNSYVNPKTEKNRKTRLRRQLSKMKKSGNLQTEQTNKTNLAPTNQKAQHKKKKKKGKQVANQIPTSISVSITPQNVPKPTQIIGTTLPLTGATPYKNAVQPNFSGLDKNRFEDQCSRKSLMENNSEFPTIVENR